MPQGGSLMWRTGGRWGGLSCLQVRRYDAEHLEVGEAEEAEEAEEERENTRTPLHLKPNMRLTE